jgi:hypothetical protein
MILGGGYIFSLIVVSRLYNHIAVVQQELLVQIELERHVRDTTGLLAELRGVGDAITTYFKTPNDVIAVIEGIEGFKKQIGAPVTVVQLDVHGADPTTREGTLVVSVFSDGSWKAMSQLMALLDTLPYQSTVTQLSLDTTGLDEDGHAPVWTLRAALDIALKDIAPEKK